MTRRGLAPLQPAACRGPVPRPRLVRRGSHPRRRGQRAGPASRRSPAQNHGLRRRSAPRASGLHSGGRSGLGLGGRVAPPLRTDRPLTMRSPMRQQESSSWSVSCAPPSYRDRYSRMVASRRSNRATWKCRNRGAFCRGCRLGGPQLSSSTGTHGLSTKALTLRSQIVDFRSQIGPQSSTSHLLPAGAGRLTEPRMKSATASDLYLAYIDFELV